MHSQHVQPILEGITAENRSYHCMGLAELNKRILKDIEIIDYPSRKWVKEKKTSTGQHIFDVIIIGAGQSGIGVAFGLQRQQINNILILDEQEKGFEGPWKTFARMSTLRTPKDLPGPNCGIPSLTFRSWYVAQHGEKAWDALEFIIPSDWSNYLVWMRELVNLPVRNKNKVTRIQWDEKENCLQIHVEKDDKTYIHFARKLVLANGIDGSGKWVVPKFISDSLPKDRYSHTRENIDFDSFKGKRVGILGAGASAFDNGIIALEAGCKEVQQFFRRKSLVKVNSYRWADFTGFLNHHSDLSDKEKWRFVHKIHDLGQLPPKNTYEKAMAFKNYSLHSACPWERVQEKDGQIEVETPKGTFCFDHLIIATGFVTDLSLRPEMKDFVDKVALWKDIYTPPKELESSGMGNFPYLGSGFQFTEKEKGQAPYLKSIFNYNYGCLVSCGFGGAFITGMKYSIPRVVNAISSQLYSDDADGFFHDFETFNYEEF